MKILSILCSAVLLTCPVIMQAQEKFPQPQGMKFTAMDGRAVDLAALRGKVVLIDFWATWCPPCRAEVPHLVEVYKKYHDKGFEIIGISLDESRAVLTEFTKKNGMVWPQYFDGKGPDSPIVTKNGIDLIPAMWLINKQGKVVSIDGQDDLAGQVEKLLSK